MAERGWWVIAGGPVVLPAIVLGPKSTALSWVRGSNALEAFGPFPSRQEAEAWAKANPNAGAIKHGGITAATYTGPAPSPAGPSPGGQAPADPHGPQPIGVWAADILNALGAPHTRNNVNNLAAWWQCESAPNPSSCGYSLNYNNPFNTEHQLAGVTGFVCNSTQVPTYDTYAHGLAATLSTIREPFAAGIVQALRDDADRATFASAVQKSGWGSSGQCIASSPATGGLVSGTGLNPAGQPLSATGAAGCAPALIAIILLILWALAW